MTGSNALASMAVSIDKTVVDTSRRHQPRGSEMLTTAGPDYAGTLSAPAVFYGHHRDMRSGGLIGVCLPLYAVAYLRVSPNPITSNSCSAKPA
jgi:hypothetical protein